MAGVNALLLLPSSSLPLSPSSLKAAMSAPLASTLHRLIDLEYTCSKGAILDIALPCPEIDFQSTQKVVAGLYSLLASIYTQESIDIAGKHGVDARILLLDPISELTSASSDQFHEESSACMISLKGLAASAGTRTHVFMIDDEPGKLIFDQFSNLATSRRDTLPKWIIEKVVAGHSLNHGVEQQVAAQKGIQMFHYAVANGGTYDHLHFGHKLLLTMTLFLIAQSPTHKLVQQQQQEEQQAVRRVIIGISDQELLKNKKFANFMESWETRQERVQEFLLAIIDPKLIETPPKFTRKSDPGANGRAVIMNLPSADLIIEFVAISDPFGPTITDEHLHALVVSGESRSGGRAVNDRRKGKGWKELDVYEVDVLDAERMNLGDSVKRFGEENFEAKISSTKIRQSLSEKIRG